MSAAAAADLLGVSRQALHKHRRIRKGFIYQTELSGKTVYLRESVELFKKTGDGRFSLHSSGVHSQNQAESVPVVSSKDRSHRSQVLAVHEDTAEYAMRRPKNAKGVRPKRVVINPEK